MRDADITSSATCPKMIFKSGSRKRMHKAVMPMEATSIVKNTCLAARLQVAASFFPKYWEQTMVPPAASARKTCSIRLLMESTKETAEMAALPMLLTMIVSTVPIRALSSCSIISGTRSKNRS